MGTLANLWFGRQGGCLPPEEVRAQSERERRRQSRDITPQYPTYWCLTCISTRDVCLSESRGAAAQICYSDLDRNSPNGRPHSHAAPHEQWTPECSSSSLDLMYLPRLAWCKLLDYAWPRTWLRWCPAGRQIGWQLMSLVDSVAATKLLLLADRCSSLHGPLTAYRRRSSHHPWGMSWNRES